MKKFFFVLLAAFCTVMVSGQVTTIPAYIPIGYDGEITIVFNPNEGNQGMVGATACWAHTGLIVGSSQWINTIGTWRQYPDKCKMTKNEDGNWELKITPNIGEFYGYATPEKVTGLCFVFNDGKINGKDGTKEGKTTAWGDIFVKFIDPAANLQAKINSPSGHQLLDEGKTMTIECAASADADLSLSINGKEVKTDHGTSLVYEHNFTDADTHLKFTATAGGKTVTDEALIAIIQPSTKKARPAGVDMGIYYDKSDKTKVTLSTYAASKTEAAKAVYVVGEFNNWTPSSESQLFQDGNYFWREITGLTPQKEYAFQYLVIRADGVKKYISDLYSEKLLHVDDKWEPKTSYPGLKAYPEEADGSYVTVIQTDKPEFEWSEETKNFRRPDKNNLIIYETWIYDFTTKRNLKGMLERLDYLEFLGVNAIELMPVNEFDGNVSWGYAPNHYFALDRAYGTETQLKTFVDECHKRGIAVILDMVFNHATGLNPMNKLYPYGTDLKNNPWFNVSAPHPDNVYEDWNHDFAPAHQMFIRALKYWIEEYKIDGYRMDLSHGLCGTSYNAVANLKDYYTNGVQAASKGAYFILEHWGTSMGSDRPQLVNAGMLCWQNTSDKYCQTAGAWLKDDDLNDANKDGYVSYCNNHDEERPFFKAKQWGEGELQDDEAVRCSRVPLNMAFLCLLNGSHLFYHFDELGYDNSKWQNAAGKWGTNPYGITVQVTGEQKMSSKANPETLGWFGNEARMDAYTKTAQIIQLRTRLLPDVFEGNPTASSLSAGKQLRTIQWGSDVFVAGNFSATSNAAVSMPSGTWYDYFEQKKANSTVVLAPNEVKIFTGKQIALPQQQTDAVDNIFTTTITAPFDAYVYTTTGQLIDVQMQAAELDQTRLEGGIYIVRLVKDGASRTYKIVK